MDGWMDGWMYGWMDGWMDLLELLGFFICTVSFNCMCKKSYIMYIESLLKKIKNECDMQVIKYLTS